MESNVPDPIAPKAGRAAARSVRYRLSTLIALTAITSVILGGLSYHSTAWTTIALIVLSLGLFFTRHWVIGVTTISAATLFWTFSPPAVFSPPTPRYRECQYHLRGIAFALLAYQRAHGCFPPAYTVDEFGNRLHSWRTLILPYLEEAELYGQIRLNEPWNSPHNSQFHRRIVVPYVCPGDPSDPRPMSYVAVVGDNTIWRGSSPVAASAVKRPHASVILLIETKNSGIHWMEPRDLEFDRMALSVNPQRGSGISSHHQRREKRGPFEVSYPGANVLFLNGSVRFLTEDTSEDELTAMFSIK